MEVIRLAGYVYEEKLAIANQYLIPQTIASRSFHGSAYGHRQEFFSLLRRFERFRQLAP